MPGQPEELPEFDDPPVVEVVLGVQFEHIKGLRGPVLASWEDIRARLPEWTEHEPVDLRTELSGPVRRKTPEVRLIFAGLPQIRSWFTNEAGIELLQIQQDFFAKNWRRIDCEYPRYPTLRAQFERDYLSLERLVGAKLDETIVPIQCEITYINRISLTDISLHDVMVGWSGMPAAGFLPLDSDTFEIAQSFQMKGLSPSQAGRLHIHAQKAQRDDESFLVLNLTARGTPLSENADGVMTWFDLAREWIVRGFADVTDSAAHHHWKRTQ